MNIQRNKTKQNGYIALMTVMIISVVLMTMIAQEGFSGWHTRFNVLGTETKEQATAFADGCINKALTGLLIGLPFTGGATSTSPIGTCYMYVDITKNPVLIKTQVQVNRSYANVGMAVNTNQLHLDPVPSSPTSGTIVIQTIVNNNKYTTKTPADFTMSVSGISPTKSSFAGSATGVVVHVSPGDYSIGETNVPTGYAAIPSADCTSGTKPITAGEIRSCTFTNNAVNTSITLIVNVKNLYRGILDPSDFQLFIDGASTTIGVATDVTPGTHKVSATVPDGYLSSPWGFQCAGDGTASTTVGDNKVCVITMADIPPPNPSCADTVMMLDRTASMSSSELTFEKTAANAMVNLYSVVTTNSPNLPAPVLGVGSFGGITSATVNGALIPNNNIDLSGYFGYMTTTYTNITTAINRMMSTNSCTTRYGSGDNCTDISAAINVGSNELTNPVNSAYQNDGKQKVLILLSDGVPSLPTGTASASTGFTSPSSIATSSTSTVVWNSPENAYTFTDGGASATTTIGIGKSQQIYSGYNFPQIPGDASGFGITADIDAYAKPINVNSASTTNLYPSSAGSFSDWLPNTGSVTTAVGSSDATDANYISTSNVTLTHTFNVTNASVPSNAAINSVTLFVTARGTTSGSSMNLVVEKDSTHVIVAPANALSTGYQTYSYTFPTTGDAHTWTQSEVTNWTNSFGVQTTGASTPPRVTQMYVVVNYTSSTTTTVPNLAPSSVGSFNTWTPSTGTAVSAVSSNDTAYISSPIQAQTFNLSAISPTVPSNAGSISVTLHARASESIGSNGNIQFMAENGGKQIYDTNQSLTSTDTDYNWPVATKPDGTAWTYTDLNNIGGASGVKFGILNATTDGVTVPKVNQVYVVASYTPITTSNTGSFSPTITHTPNSWTNASNGWSSTNYTTDTTNGHQQGYSNFNLPTIPSNATINGIAVMMYAKSTGSNCVVDAELSYDGGFHFTNSSNNTPSLSSTAVSYTLGGSVDNWGRTWTPSNFTNSNFVVRLQDDQSNNGCSSFRSSPTLSVNQIQVVVYYSISGTTVTQTLTPSSVGSFNTWTPSTGTAVSAVSSNDSTYISSPIQAQTFNLSAISPTVPSNAGSISVTLHARASESIGSNGNIQFMAENGGKQIYDTNQSLTSTDTDYNWPVATKPDGTAWTYTDLNNIGGASGVKFGILNATTDGVTVPKVNQVYVVVTYATASIASTTNLYPSSAGSFSDWLPNTGSITTAVGSSDATDANYISTSNVTLTHTFNVTNASVPSNAAINSVTLFVTARGTTSGSSMNLVVEKDSTHVIVAPANALSTSYQTYSYTFPTTGDAHTWTQSEVTNWTNSFGVQTTGASTPPRVTQMYVVVNYVPTSACKIGLELSWDGGNTWTSGGFGFKSQTLNGSSTTYQLGNSTDAWGTTHTWTVADFSTDNFRTRISGLTNGTLCQSTDVDYLDWLRVNVNYSRSAPKQAALNASDAAKLAGTNIFTIYYNATPVDADKNFMAELANGTYAYPPYQNGSLYNSTTTTSGTPARYAASFVTPNTWTNAKYGFTTGTFNYATSNAALKYQGYSGFDFTGSYAIAPTATINNLRFDFQAKAPSRSGCSLGLEVSTDGGLTFTTSGSKVSLTNTSNASYNIGASTIASTQWGRTFASTDFDPSKFVVRLQDIRGTGCSSSGTLYVNSLKTTISWIALGENSDGDNFFISTSPDQMQEIFNYIGNNVCPAAHPSAITTPTAASVIIMTRTINDNSTSTLTSSAFTTVVNSSGQAPSTLPGADTPGTTVTINPGTYIVTENPMSGYTETLGSGCLADGSTNNPAIAAGETRICIITNDDIPPPPPPPNLSIGLGLCSIDPSYCYAEGTSTAP